MGDTTFDQSKLFYRRGLACEQLKEYPLAVDDMARALQQAKKAELSLAEQHKLKGEWGRLKKLKVSNESHDAKKQEERDNERNAEVERMQGSSLGENTKPNARAVPLIDDGSYIKEQDFSHWAKKQVLGAIQGICHKGASGCSIEVVELQEGPSKI